MKVNYKRINDQLILVIDNDIYQINEGITNDIFDSISMIITILTMEINDWKPESTFKEWQLLMSESASLRESFDVNSGPDITLTEELINHYNNLLDMIIPERIVKREAEKIAKQEALDKLEMEKDEVKRIDNAKRIAAIPDNIFEYDINGICYLTGFNHPMPQILVDAILNAYYNPESTYTIDSLINFWKFLLLNPDKHVRIGLFQWIKTGQFAITEEGNLISYRNVNVKTKSVSKELEDFISKSWVKVKTIWKKSPKHYWVYKISDTEFSLNIDVTDINVKLVIGNLATLYADLDTQENTTVYTDQYTGTMEIKIGESVKMARDKCDNSPDSSCSYGLHQKTASHGAGFGSNALICLVNPYNVVAIPNYDYSKFRCCEYLPIAEAELDENGKIKEIDSGTYNLEYNGIENLIHLLSILSLDNLQESGIVSKEIDSKDFKIILSKIQEVINDRNIDIDGCK